MMAAQWGHPFESDPEAKLPKPADRHVCFRLGAGGKRRRLLEGPSGLPEALSAAML